MTLSHSSTARVMRARGGGGCTSSKASQSDGASTLHGQGLPPTKQLQVSVLQSELTHLQDQLRHKDDELRRKDEEIARLQAQLLASAAGADAAAPAPDAPRCGTNKPRPRLPHLMQVSRVSRRQMA